MTQAPLASLHKLVWTALLAALVAVGAYVHVPFGSVPFTLQTFFVILAGFVLGPISGATALILYVAAGLIGLPVFSGGRAGIGMLLGPTGGYLIGFIVCAALCGRAALAREAKFLPGLAWGALGVAAMYAFGVARLMFVIDAGLWKAISVGCLPFLPGAAVKLVGAVLTWQYLAKRRLLPS